jgi:diaminopimelate decarboxylase
MIDYINIIRQQGFNLEYLNIGSGIRINNIYNQAKNIPKPLELINSIRNLINDVNIKLIIEPVRSLVADTCILVNKVIGVK